MANTSLLTNCNKVLVLSPHTDDAELWCGGTITKLLEVGKEVHWAVFSESPVLGKRTIQNKVALSEMYTAAKKLGMDKKNIHLLKYKVRTLPMRRQEVLEDMLKLRAKLQPDLVFLPTSGDMHQDHQAVHNEGLRAFKHTTLLGCDTPWNQTVFPTTSFSKLSRAQLDTKIAAIEKYTSQSNRPYMRKEFLEGWARMRGLQAGSEYAEAFEVIRFIF